MANKKLATESLITALTGTIMIVQGGVVKRITGADFITSLNLITGSPAALPKQLLAEGDSNTATIYNPSTSHASATLRTGWFEQLSGELPAEYTLDHNDAVPGAISADTATQAATLITYEDTVDFSQTIALLQIGVNDISWEEWRPSMHQIAAYIFAWGNDMRKAGIKPILITPPCHRNYYPADSAKDTIVMNRWAQLVGILKANYLDYGFVGLVDLTLNPFIGQATSVVNYASYWLDSIHWNTAGQALVAADAAPVIETVAAATMPAYTELPPYTEPVIPPSNEVVWQDMSAAVVGSGADSPNTLVSTGGIGGANSTVTIDVNGTDVLRGWIEFEIGVNTDTTWAALKKIHGGYTYGNHVLAWQMNPAGTSGLPTAAGAALPSAVGITTAPGDIARIALYQDKAVFLINGVSVYEIVALFPDAYWFSNTLIASGDKIRNAKIFAATPAVTPTI